MPAITQCCIQPCLPGSYFEKLQYFIHKNRTMHSCRSAPLLQHLFYVFSIFLRLKLFVFFFKRFWMRALVSFSARRLCSFVIRFHFKSSLTGENTSSIFP